MLVLDYNAVLNPYFAPWRLLISVETDGRPECGVFSGRHAGFRDAELMDKRQPLVEEDFDESLQGEGFETFEIRGLQRPPENQIWQYHFVIISWKTAVYVEYPEAKELTVTLESEGGWFSYRGLRVNLMLRPPEDLV